MNENQILILRDNAKNELTQLKTLEEGIIYFNKIKAFGVWVKAERMDAELQNLIAIQKIRTQRVLGQLIKDGQETGEIATPGFSETLKQNTDSIQPEESERPKTIPELGLTHKQSSNFQQIAEIPEDTFEEFISEGKAKVDEAVKELTTTAAVKLAKSLKEKKQTIKPIYDEPNLEQELDELLKRIEKLPIEYRIKIRNAVESMC